jgi:hypothetical protein
MSNPLDPLSDPLSMMNMSSAPAPAAKPIESDAKEDFPEAENEVDDHMSPWNIRKQQIQRDYAISGNITLNSSAIDEFAGSGVEDGSRRNQVDKYTQRLANLEKKQEKSDGKVQLSTKEYEAHISKLSSDLTTAWSKDERVASLKIAIQLAKLLGDTNMPQFYPAMFVMVTNELDR